MYEYHCKIDTVFEAENIDDAFEKLSGHFSNVIDSKLEHIGEMSIKKVEDDSSSN